MKKLLVYLILLILTTGCQPVRADEYVAPSSTSTLHISQTAPVETSASFPTQVTLRQPTLDISNENNNIPLSESDSMPIFLEVIQTTLMSEDAAQNPALSVGPTIYFYDQDSRILTLSSAINLETSTELFIGVATVLQTSREMYEKKEIIQYPSTQTTLIQISALDAETGILNLVYADETFSLSPGDSRTFKQVSDDSKTSTVITLVSNHGHLTDIRSISPDGSWR